jgi:hypothetical protein
VARVEGPDPEESDRGGDLDRRRDARWPKSTSDLGAAPTYDRGVRGRRRTGDGDDPAAGGSPELPGCFCSLESLTGAGPDELAAGTFEMLFRRVFPDGTSFHPPSEMRHVWKAMGLRRPTDMQLVEARVNEGASELLRGGLVFLHSSSSGVSYHLTRAGREALGKPPLSVPS